MSYFRNVDRLTDRFPELCDIIRFFSIADNSAVSLDKWFEVYGQFDEENAQIWEEQLLVYVIYRYLMRGFEYGDYLKKYLIGIELVFEMIISVIALFGIVSGRKQTFDEMVMTIAHVSRMIEHSSTFVNQALEHFEEKGLTELQFVLKLMS